MLIAKNTFLSETEYPIRNMAKLAMQKNTSERKTFTKEREIKDFSNDLGSLEIFLFV